MISVEKKPLMAYECGQNRVIVGTIHNDPSIGRDIMQGIGRAGEQTLLPKKYDAVEVKTSPLFDSDAKLLDDLEVKTFTGWSWGDRFIVRDSKGIFTLETRIDVAFMRIRYTNWRKKLNRNIIRLLSFGFGLIVTGSVIYAAIIKGL